MCRETVSTSKHDGKMRFYHGVLRSRLGDGWVSEDELETYIRRK